MDDDPEYRIAITNRDPSAPPCADRLRRVVTLALARHRVSRAELSLVVVDDAEMARLHERHLGRAEPTDVLSFDLSDRTDPPGQRRSIVEGEIVVSWETARREAGRRGHAAEAELCLYAVHGTLHLLGYDDAVPADAETMHGLEDELLTEAGIGAVYGREAEA